MEPVVNYDHKTIQMRRGTTAEWRRYGAICIPAEGEICIEFFQEADGKRNGLVGLKVGNGTSVFNALPYLITNQTQDDRISNEQIDNWDLTVEKLANLTAAEIDQKNVDLGDNVQEALDELHARLVAIDPDGGSIEINDIGGLEDALNDKADKDHAHDEITKDAAYIKYVTDKWEASPDLNVTGEWSVEGNTERKGDVTLDSGDLIFNGGGIEGDVSINGNITIEGGGAIIDGGGNPISGSAAWDDITGKPAEYPPEAHTHEQGDVDGLELRLQSIEDSITSGGGFVDAPNDGQLYGRQSEAWAVVPAGGASSWNDLTDKPTAFPPEAHGHAWDEITGKPTEFPPANAVMLTGDQSVAGHKTWTGIATFGDTVILRGSINGDDTANFQNAVTAGSFVKSGGTSAEYLMADGSVSAGPEAGGSVQIGETFDGTPAEGDQWLETPAGGEAVMWIYDGEKWLQMPSAGGGLEDAPNDGEMYVRQSSAWAQIPETDLSDYYTSTEADAKFQPKGDYIEDAPSDGELYVRKDGKWELYTPSSGGGGGGYMVPIQQPQTAGDFKWGVASAGGGGVFKNTHANWYCNKNTNTMTMPVPPGYKFVLQNFIANASSSSFKNVAFNGVYLDGIQINTSPDTVNEYKSTYPSGDPTYDRKYFWPAPVNYVCESSVQFTTQYSGDVWFHIFGYFIAADGTRESAELREAYLAEEAERIASMPVTMDLLEEGDE